MVEIVLTVARRSVRTVGRNTDTARWPLAKWVQAATTARVPEWTAVLRCTHETTIVPALIVLMAPHVTAVIAIPVKTRAGMALLAEKVAVAESPFVTTLPRSRMRLRAVRLLGAFHARGTGTFARPRSTPDLAKPPRAEARPPLSHVTRWDGWELIGDGPMGPFDFVGDIVLRLAIRQREVTPR